MLTARDCSTTMLASGNPVAAHRARFAVKSDGIFPVVDRDPFQQRRHVGGLNSFVAPCRAEPGAEFLGRCRSECQAGGALDDLAEARIGTRAAKHACKREKGRRWPFVRRRTSATRSAAAPSLR